MKDKLDIFLDLIKPTKPSSENPYIRLLSSVSYYDNADAFLFLYESMPEEYKPDFKTSPEHFKNSFLSAIKKQDEKTFNKYFFSGLHESLDINKIRQLHFEFPNNLKLKEYVNKHDNPQNIDDIVGVLSQLWREQSDRYDEMFNQSLPKLQKLSEIKSKKSRAAENFSYWGSIFIEREGLQNFFQFCETIKLEPFNFCLKTGKNFSLEPEKMSYNDIEFLINYAEKLILSGKEPKIKYSYEIIEKVSRYAPILDFLSLIIRTESTEKRDIFTLIWKTQQGCISESLKKYGMTLTQPDNTLEALKEFVNEIFILPKLGYDRDTKLYKDDLNTIISWANYAELQINLPVNEELKQGKKIKI